MTASPESLPLSASPRPAMAIWTRCPTCADSLASVQANIFLANPQLEIIYARTTAH